MAGIECSAKVPQELELEIALMAQVESRDDIA